MTVSLVQWRAVIGVFHCRILGMYKNCENYVVNNFICLIESWLLLYHCFESAYIFLLTLLYLLIELNTGPKKLENKLLSVCHWNLNSLTTHNYSKLSQLKAYISFHCINMTLCAYQKHILILRHLFEIDGYNLVRADHPDKIKEVEFVFTIKSHSLFEFTIFERSSSLRNEW